ncbi:MAG: hypothetical protein O3C28_08115 [Proteobacteria bacterium]|nr:hypothetical protein [Pseudomonadota bacterium]
MVEKRTEYLRVKFTLLVLFLTSSIGALSAAPALEEYVGKPSEQLLRALGEPLLRSPTQLLYSRKSEPRGGKLGAPQVIIQGASSKFIVGSEYEQLSVPDLPCDLNVGVDAAGLVNSIERKGPGCTEFIYLLQQQQASKQSKPGKY